jgi:hypothetical protein
VSEVWPCSEDKEKKIYVDVAGGAAFSEMSV